MHLNPDELVDLAEGARAESSLPHLAACADCRRQLADMRAMMTAAIAADVPEPSPLFWEHLSARVSEAVVADGHPSHRWFQFAAWRRALMPASAVAAALVVVFALFNARVRAPQPHDVASPTTFAAAPPDVTADANSGSEVLGDATEDDASLMLVAGMTSAIDLDAASDAGLAPTGSAEHAVTHMASDELRELSRLLREEMVGS
jgi:anti-sigma-K factor RskA